MSHTDVSAYEDNNISYIGPLTKRERRQLKKNKTKNRKGGTGIRLENIEPITNAQTRAFQAFNSDKNILLHGVAGTGKTFVSLFLDFYQAIKKRNLKYMRPHIIPYVANYSIVVTHMIY